MGIGIAERSIYHEPRAQQAEKRLKIKKSRYKGSWITRIALLSYATTRVFEG